MRNIASIEVADIDFEKGLIDGVTGDPASVFLISGDTGAGKSVILDGISMALYKNTPRISGVANKRENDFTDTTGEKISINSIEQYTRLGISEKEECYSEVAFTGNDGVEYRARLTLGMLLGNTDKTTGKRSLKHRTPKWEIQIDNGGWTKDNVEQTILSAIGLSYKQFGRMAMLAQGQFAAFLTGDKAERESILEQLTNTEHFTAYGKAIKSLFDQAKDEHAKVKVEYETEAQHTLSQEKVDFLTAEKKSLDEEKVKLDGKVKKNDDTIALVKAVENARESANLNGAEKAELEKTASGEEYKSKKGLVQDWDATTTERQRLSDMKDARKKLSEAKTEESRQKELFMVLSADLEAKREALKAQGNPQKAIDDKQKEIDALAEQRAALEPAKVNAELLQISADKTALGKLSTGYDKLLQDSSECRTLHDEVEKDGKAIAGLQETYDKAQAEYNVAKAKSDETKGRLLTMKMGVEETLVNLRKRLVDEHAETCPLCRQRIQRIGLDEEFRGILTSFEKGQKEAADALAVAEDSRNKAKTAYDNFAGALKTKKVSLEVKEKAIKAAGQKLIEEGKKLGVIYEEGVPFNKKISAVEDSLKEREAALKERQNKAEELQGKITEAQNAKKPLDEALRKYKAAEDTIKRIEESRISAADVLKVEITPVAPVASSSANVTAEWDKLIRNASATSTNISSLEATLSACNDVLEKYYAESGKGETDLESISARKDELDAARKFTKEVDESLKSKTDAVTAAEKAISEALGKLGISEEKDVPEKQALLSEKETLRSLNDEVVGKIGTIKAQLDENAANNTKLAGIKARLDKAAALASKWDILNKYFGGTRFRTLVQTYILRPLLNNANIYLAKITDRYKLTCSEDNEQLSILVLDRYNKDQIRSVTVLSGGERFMISLALSLALSSLNRPDMNVNILFIDEGFGTLDEKSLESVMETLEKLQEIAGQSERRVGIISHREELDERIPVQIQVKKKGEGRSRIEIKNILA